MATSASSQYREASELDPKFSTTRLVTLKKPIIENNCASKVQSCLFLPPNPERKGEGGLRTKGYFKQSYNKVNESSNNSTLPLVSIITIVFNGEEYLEKTIESVINQTYNNVEYIVIDGNSTDSTLDIVRKYEDKIDYWVSEKDKGIADAMNKGISLASGNLIHHLHSGDLFDNEHTVSQVVLSYIQNKWRWCYGNQKKINSSGEVTFWLYPPKVNKRLLYLCNVIPHSTVFSEKSLLQEVGYFDNRFECAMDYHLWLRCIQIANPEKIDLIIARFLEGGFSSDFIVALTDEIKARKDVLDQNIVEKFLDFCFTALRYLKWKFNITTFARNQEIN